MTKVFLAASLVAAAITSSAALAAPKGDSSGDSVQPGTYFNCVIPLPGPKAFRIGGCWLDQASVG